MWTNCAPGQITAADCRPYHIINGRGLEIPDAAGLAWWQRYLDVTSALVADPHRHQAWWDQFVLRSWRVFARERVRGLTEKLCEGDAAGLRHGQNHFISPAHYTCYGRACELTIAGIAEDPQEQADIEGWLAGAWPS